MKLILASSSSRRAEILANAGLPFSVLSSAVDESPYPGETPAALVQRLANAKADLVTARAVGPAAVVGADTVVVLDDKILGKPRSTEEARHMLPPPSGPNQFLFIGPAGAAPSPRPRAPIHKTTRSL